MKRDDLVALAVSVGGPLVLGQLAALPGLNSIRGWYKRLKKPRWTPPTWVFPVVWPVLYAAQGVSSFLVWRNKDIKGAKRNVPLGLYGAQLFLNLIWQPIMFKLHRTDIALADSIAMTSVAAAATVTMTLAAKDKRDKIAVGTMMGAYCAWLGFATALSGKIWKENPHAENIEDTPVEEPAKALKTA